MIQDKVGPIIKHARYEYTYVWQHEENRLVPFVRNHSKIKGNRLQAIPL